ncbi:hypothetical protein RND81_08G208000 [Saponaria officinalis]|uniref:Uncharacterized protein n=1 Tax=Saponaria officinalis TaxID=3572 RepID=A0AAW1JCA2_SAPOF
MVPYPYIHSLRDQSIVLPNRFNSDSLKMVAKDWFRNFMNCAIFIWMVAITVSVAVLLLVLTGMLNNVLPDQSQRNTWLDVDNQIIAVLFTLMSLYHHPQRLYHLVLLSRWNANDIHKLRMVYCKNGTYKPHEWAHMLVVVLVLDLSCFAQYALCGLIVGYKKSDRPAIGLGITISVVLTCAVVAGVYPVFSPLGKEYDIPVDEEAEALRHPLI